MGLSRLVNHIKHDMAFGLGMFFRRFNAHPLAICQAILGAINPNLDSTWIVVQACSTVVGKNGGVIDTIAI